MRKSNLIFYGGVETVTGSNFMIESNGNKILIDCGLFQGESFCEDNSCYRFEYNPSEIDKLLVTHAHADHIGRIPKLARDGFEGEIYSTAETMELAKVMFDDALKILTREAQEKSVEPIYDKEDIKKALSLWKVLPYGESFNLKDGLSFKFRDAGHILGSAMIEIERDGRKIVFSGDLGNSPSPFLRDTEDIKDANYLVIESVYGDREHEDEGGRKEKLEEAVKKTIQNKGTLIIPAFSISRTQIMLFELNEMVENGKIEPIPVFLDSPLAIKVTEVYYRYQDNFNKNAKGLIKSGDNIFDFPKLKMTETVEASKDIAGVNGPKIIIAGSGMSTGGRVLHHEKRYLSDPNNILLIVGYQAPGSLGRVIQDGAKSVKIQDKDIPVKAEIMTVTGYSGHKGSDDLLKFVASSQENLEKVFVVMGEPESSLFFAQKIKDNLNIETINPEKGKKYEINL